MAHSFENIQLHSMKKHHDPVCNAPICLFCSRNSSLCDLWSYRRAVPTIIHLCHRHKTKRPIAREYLKHLVLSKSEGIIWKITCTSPTTVSVCNVLYNIDVSMPEYLMDWVTSIVKQHLWIGKFIQLLAMIPPYPAFAQMGNPYCQLRHWSVKKVKVFWHGIIPDCVEALFHLSARKRMPFKDALLFIWTNAYFHMMAQYQYHTEARIVDKENHMESVSLGRSFAIAPLAVCLPCWSSILSKCSLLWTHRGTREWPWFAHSYEAAQRVCVDVEYMQIMYDIA